ncbi:MAG: winged helix-turn-helix transcriptional regulator [Christensenellaceae bacterium]
MYQKKLESDIRCPLEYAITLFGGKWKNRIICVLSKEKTMRYRRLRDQLVNVTDAVLSTALKELVADGLVSRMQYDETPPRVEYALTEKGESIVPLLKEICAWAEKYYRAETEDLPYCRKCDFRAQE